MATGILLFLLWDVLAAGIEPVEAALNAAAIDHDGTWARFAGLAAIFVGCFAVGLMSLVYFDQVIARRRRRDGFLSLGAASITEYDVQPGALSPAQSLSLMIATGIGLHNFSEGLAIGQSAPPVRSTLHSSSSSASACTTRLRASASSARSPARRSGRRAQSSRPPPSQLRKR